ncbi:hypothetical protein KEM48_007345 [Puccinia striiformis f. sp. tritici PST-130]|nr:hypothetical protein H4Q26_007393 [Puccinia striiformis f. sp. tritici PST-130]KAI9622166.1 hypothetical protein KEM48_007345 [Puccinia striiformis f. sp. tritici PST-130]
MLDSGPGWSKLAAGWDKPSALPPPESRTPNFLSIRYTTNVYRFDPTPDFQLSSGASVSMARLTLVRKAPFNLTLLSCLIALCFISGSAGKPLQRSLGQLSRGPGRGINRQTLFVHPSGSTKSNILVRREAKGKPF